MNIEYKTIKWFNKKELVELFTSVGWVEESAKYPHRLEMAMRCSNAVFSAWDGDKLVGLLSAIDDSMHAYVTYLLVEPAYQKQGIGTFLLKMYEERYRGYKKELKTEESEEYYKRFNYKIDSTGMVKNDLPDRDMR